MRSETFWMKLSKKQTKLDLIIFKMYFADVNVPS